MTESDLVPLVEQYRAGLDAELMLLHRLQAISVDLREYDGQVAATVEVPLRWSAEGVRFLELYVVTKKGNTSNRLRAPLTVR